ncbi:MAG: hypothetical protein OEV66_11435 [Spirochaetia bacterium]|nr:hypothetical protein [Spirochaetia bacterium]
MKKEYKNHSGKLILKVFEENNIIFLSWHGKSLDLSPGDFLFPVFREIFDGNENNIVMNFEDLQYWDSSSIAVLIKLLGEIKKGNRKITLEYKADEDWQQLSFTALQVFQTPDERIKIIGK